MLYDNNTHLPDSSNFTLPHNDYTFFSKERDTESGLSYFGARMYDSWNGTWTAQDVMRGNTFMPETQHRYGFVKNNPINYFDPNGYSWYGDAWNATTGAVSSAATSAYQATAGAVSAAGDFIGTQFDQGLQAFSDLATFDVSFNTPQVNLFNKQIIPASTVNVNSNR